jgi:hypothetical protein
MKAMNGRMNGRMGRSGDEARESCVGGRSRAVANINRYG